MNIKTAEVKLEEKLTAAEKASGDWKPSTRFDYVAYDDTAQLHAEIFKKKFVEIEAAVETHFPIPRSPGVARYKAMLISKLEEAYMFVGKTIRDDQIARNGAAPLQEKRNNG